MTELIKVSKTSRPTAVAGAIAGVMRKGGYAEIQAIGAGAVNQSVKALATARNYLKEDGIDLAAVPSFTEVEIDGSIKTAVHMAIYKQSDVLDSELDEDEDERGHGPPCGEQRDPQRRNPSGPLARPTGRVRNLRQLQLGFRCLQAAPDAIPPVWPLPTGPGLAARMPEACKGVSP